MMPRHSEDTNSFTMRVITNRRPDGKQQYKVTLPKQIGDLALAINKSVYGEFHLKQLPDYEQKELVFEMSFYRNPSESHQEAMINTEWQPLRCPYCEVLAEPLMFPEGADPISHKRTHTCGSIYYADRSDNRSKSEWDKIPGTGKDWKIVHNYHIQFGKVGNNLSPDFDILDDDDRLVHVIFNRPRNGDTSHVKLD